MIRKYLTNIIALPIATMSIIALASDGVSATNTISIEQAKTIISNSCNIFWKIGRASNLTFEKEISPKDSKYYTVFNVDALVENQENLYVFKDSISVTTHYFIGVNTGKTYVYDGGHGAGTFTLVDNNLAVKQWLWERHQKLNASGNSEGWTYDEWKQNNGWKQYDNKWYYYKNGVNQTGWFYDNGNWYYFNSNGEMAHDTTIGGYYLGSSGAWTN